MKAPCPAGFQPPFNSHSCRPIQAETLESDANLLRKEYTIGGEDLDRTVQAEERDENATPTPADNGSNRFARRNSREPYSSPGLGTQSHHPPLPFVLPESQWQAALKAS